MIQFPGFAFPSFSDIVEFFRSTKLKFVWSAAQFPAASSGVRTLEDDTTYVIIGTVDLNGDRLVCGDKSTFFGFSPEVSILKSTGFDDTGGAFLTSEYTVPINLVGFHDFGSEQVLDIDGEGNEAALDWNGINFLNCQNIGTIANVSNFISNTMGILSSGGLVFDGEIGTVGINNTIGTRFDGGPIITLPATLEITRRFRIIYSAFVATSGNTALDVSTSAIIPDEGYILDTVNFSGGGTYINGVNQTSEKALFSGCRGISNTTTRGGYYMNNNALNTNILTTNTPQKILGSTTAVNLISKFTITDNRATYTGALTEGFFIAAAVSFDTSIMRDYTIKIAKNGVVQNSQSTIRGTNTINLECTLFDSVNLETNDYIEVWVQSNQTGNLLVTDMNLIITRLS